MGTFLRFSETEPTQNEISYNGFNGTQLNGLCCFELDENDSIYVQVRNFAKNYSNYVKNSNGVCFVFEGEFLENNFNNEGVISSYSSTIEKLELVFNDQSGYFIK